MADCDRHRLGDCTAVTARTSRLGAIGLSPRGEAAQLRLVEAIARAIDTLDAFVREDDGVVDAPGRQGQFDEAGVHLSGELRLGERVDQGTAVLEEMLGLLQPAAVDIERANDAGHRDPVRPFRVADQHLVDDALRLVPAAQLDSGIHRVGRDEPPVPTRRPDASRPRDPLESDREALFLLATDQERRAEIGEPAAGVVDVVRGASDVETFA